ncbi:hypothetical protein M422DRAFT_53837 [Sphaerobolus stellatus SS14]|uniref:Uncharacterized protein n=1 Tax=Sphaerobolus stellatus (strain SS14) TaxID=990650 RepID=A0A0C9UXV7_SPHS4|nr:hypothetical protein M422DRAFT_53837 [Sphaerobolus stellatus SS14]
MAYKPASMGRRRKYNTPEEAHAAHLEQKRQYYSRNKKAEQRKSRKRYEHMIAEGRPKLRRPPPPKAVSLKPVQEVPTELSIIVTAPASFKPRLRVAPNTKMDILIAALWKRLMGTTPPRFLLHAQKSRYEAIMNMFETLSHETAMSRLLQMTAEGKVLVDTAWKAMKEAIRRDPSQRSPEVPMVVCAHREIEQIQGLTEECKSYLKMGISSLEEAHRKKWLCWQ